MRPACAGLWVGLFAICGCSLDAPPTSAAEAPAHVEAAKPEAELTTVRLSPEAVRRLGIETAVAQIDAAAATRTLGGEVVVPEGRLVTVTAPFPGTVIGPPGPQPGTRVSRGTRLLTITPLMSSDRDQTIEARRAVDAAQADATVMRLRLQRLEQLLKEGAASVRSTEEARGQLLVAEAALNAARERLSAVREGPVGAQGEITITAPIDGLVQSISAASGQTVAASAPLIQIAQVSTLWVRVPVFAGAVDDIDSAQAASVTRLGGADPPRPAMRVTAPLRADPTAASVDLYYELSSAGATLRPGERVMVELPLKTAQRGLVVPDAAVLYDIHGDAWVYQDMADRIYVRKRVQIARHAGGRAVIASGIAEGATVVTAGAAELFGTEFGAGH